MDQLTCATIYESMRDRLGLNDVKVSIRGVKMNGPGDFVPATEARILPDNTLTLAQYAQPDFDWFVLEGTFDDQKHSPGQKLTREEFLMELLDRLDSFAERIKYLPIINERIKEEIDIAQHYIKGAYDLDELRDMSYLEVRSANLQLPLP